MGELIKPQHFLALSERFEEGGVFRTWQYGRFCKLHSTTTYNKNNYKKNNNPRNS